MADLRGADRSGNTRAGTIVDRGVTSLVDAGLQGFVRPTHYVVVYDKSSLPAVQQCVHTASYLYAHATEAISLAPHAYSADFLCEEACFWIQGFLNQGCILLFLPITHCLAKAATVAMSGFRRLVTVNRDDCVLPFLFPFPTCTDFYETFFSHAPLFVQAWEPSRTVHVFLFVLLCRCLRVHSLFTFPFSVRFFVGLIYDRVTVSE